ncbi:uncharacterized protein si:ch211-63p21.1 isoform X1 [Takifugu flavidus]|uniref:Uncharacterized protein n=2 Tax=Takifugu flavidus TaxID=433684 RepID=A0A5C6N9E3_9TELE|nr:uncharacterized protein si:ch211-63p21.1 isoform X1 [Takifugu flavidus]XP_056884366.1 uncharacterized protein si:ch211-63p21.1 isoform X1 [Takifugu flavidus]TWW63479.1 hypothetical protein D4764_03G0004870 [Takifugu flavidus]
MLRRESDSHGLFSSGETSDNDCEMEASCREVDAVCLCNTGPCTLYSEAHTLTPDTLLCHHCGKSRVMVTRYSEGYGTEEECLLSDPQGESDADADIEDTDCRLQEPGSLQRISSRRRKRPRVSRQDTTESEDDGGRSHRSHRWNLRLSPDRTRSRTILEESISQVRPLVICQPNVEKQNSPFAASRSSRLLTTLWSPSLSLPLVLLVSLPLSLSLVIVIVSFFLPWARA